MVNFLVCFETTEESSIDAQVTPPEVPVTHSAVGLLADTPPKNIFGHFINQWVLASRRIDDDLLLANLWNRQFLGFGGVSFLYLIYLSVWNLNLRFRFFILWPINSLLTRC